jgi:hypothetical protein
MAADSFFEVCSAPIPLPTSSASSSAITHSAFDRWQQPSAAAGLDRLRRVDGLSTGVGPL